MQDFQIYADVVRRHRIEEAERERLINAARAGHRNGPSFLGRLIKLLKSPFAGGGKAAKDSTPSVDLHKREPAV